MLSRGPLLPLGPAHGPRGPEPSTREASRAFGRLLHLTGPAVLVPVQPRDLRGQNTEQKQDYL